MPESAWQIWVDHCRSVDSWYKGAGPEPFGINPPTQQIVDATLKADRELAALRASLSAALAAKEKAEGALCRAGRELGNIKVSPLQNPAPWDDGHRHGVWEVQRAFDAALSSSAPCACGEKVKDVEGMAKVVSDVFDETRGWGNADKIDRIVRALSAWLTGGKP